MTWLYKVLEQKPLAEFMSMQPSSGQWQGVKNENAPLVMESTAKRGAACSSHRGKAVTECGFYLQTITLLAILSKTVPSKSHNIVKTTTHTFAKEKTGKTYPYKELYRIPRWSIICRLFVIHNCINLPREREEWTKFTIDTFTVSRSEGIHVHSIWI